MIGSKKLGSERILPPKKFVSKIRVKNLKSRKIPNQTKILIRTKLWAHKNIEGQKYLGQRKFLSKKIFGLKRFG